MPPLGSAETSMMGRPLRHPTGARVLVADGDRDFADRLRDLLEREGHRTAKAASAESCLDLLDRGAFDAVVLDLGLRGEGGAELLAGVLAAAPHGQVVATTASDEAGPKVAAMSRGAFACLAKPLEPLEVLLVVRRALRLTRLQREAARLRRFAPGRFAARLVGRSDALRRSLDLVERVAPTRSNVLVRGEEGVGKEAVARTIHALSPRDRGPFVAVRCTALSEPRAAAELFGFVEGALPEVGAGRRGLVEEADGGTLFLDEIVALPAPLQPELLRLLEERRARRAGSDAWIPLDVRVVAASPPGIGERDGTPPDGLRADLFHHFAVYPIDIPPLRSRREDVPLLVDHFRRRFRAENGVTPPAVTAEAMDRMVAYDWPGNVRELENFVERALILHGSEDAIRWEPPPAGVSTDGSAVLDDAARNGWDLARLEKAYILKVLERTGGNQTRAAQILGIDRRTVYRKLKRYRQRGAGS